MTNSVAGFWEFHGILRQDQNTLKYYINKKKNMDLDNKSEINVPYQEKWWGLYCTFIVVDREKLDQCRDVCLL